MAGTHSGVALGVQRQNGAGWPAYPHAEECAAIAVGMACILGHTLHRADPPVDAVGSQYRCGCGGCNDHTASTGRRGTCGAAGHTQPHSAGQFFVVAGSRRCHRLAVSATFVNTTVATGLVCTGFGGGHLGFDGLWVTWWLVGIAGIGLGVQPNMVTMALVPPLGVGALCTGDRCAGRSYCTDGTTTLASGLARDSAVLATRGSLAIRPSFGLVGSSLGNVATGRTGVRTSAVVGTGLHRV